MRGYELVIISVSRIVQIVTNPYDGYLSLDSRICGDGVREVKQSTLRWGELPYTPVG